MSCSPAPRMQTGSGKFKTEVFWFPNCSLFLCSWCPDCVTAEPVVNVGKYFLNEYNLELTIIYLLESYGVCFW